MPDDNGLAAFDKAVATPAQDDNGLAAFDAITQPKPLPGSAGQQHLTPADYQPHTLPPVAQMPPAPQRQRGVPPTDPAMQHGLYSIEDYGKKLAKQKAAQGANQPFSINAAVAAPIMQLQALLMPNTLEAATVRGIGALSPAAQARALNAQSFAQNVAPVAMQKLQMNPDSGAAGFAKGVAALVSPDNAVLGGVLQKLKMLGAVGAVARAGIDAYFTLHFGAEGAKQIHHAIQTGNASQLGEGAANALMGLAGAAGLADEGIGKIGEMRDAKAAAKGQAGLGKVNEQFRQANANADRIAQQQKNANATDVNIVPEHPNTVNLPDIPTMANAFRQGRQSFTAPDAQAMLKAVVALKSIAPDLIVQGARDTKGNFTISAVPKPGAEGNAPIAPQETPAPQATSAGIPAKVPTPGLPVVADTTTPTQAPGPGDTTTPTASVNPLRGIAAQMQTPEVPGFIRIADLWDTAQKAIPGITQEQFGAHVADLLNSREYDIEHATGNTKGMMLKSANGAPYHIFGLQRGEAKPTEAPAVTAPLQTPMPAPEAAKPETSPAENTPAEPTQPEAFTGVKNAVTDAERKARGLEPVPKQEPVTDEELKAAAQQALKADPQAGKRLAAEVEAKPRTLSAQEVYVLGQDRVRIINEHNALHSALETAIDKGDTVEQARLRDEIASSEKEYDTNDTALKKGGGEQGRSLRSRQHLLNEEGNLVQVLQRAKNNKGAALTEQERAHYTKVVSDLNDANKKIEEYEAQKKAATENPGAPPTKAVAKAKTIQEAAGRRKLNREALATEREAIWKDINKALGRNVGAGPGQALIDAAPHVKRLFKNWAQTAENTSLDDFVKMVQERIPDLSARNIRDMLSGYGMPSDAKARSTTQRRITDLTKEAELLSRLEDEQTGQHTTGRAIGKPVDNEAAAKLRKQIQDIHDTRAKAAAAKAKADKLDTAIKTLEAQVKSGQVPELPKGTPKPKSAQEARLAELKAAAADIRAKQRAEAAKPAREEAQAKAEAERTAKNIAARAAKIDAAIKDLETQLQTGNLKEPTKATLTAKTPQETRLADLRQQVAKARAEQNKLTDLADRLEKEQQGVETRQPAKPTVPESVQATAIRKQIDQIQSDRDARATIADIQEQLRTGNYKDTTKPAPQAKTALQQELADARKALSRAKNPPMSQDTKDANSIARRKVAIQKDLTELNRQLKTGNFSSKRRPYPAATDPELQRLTRERDIAKQKVKNAIDRQLPGQGWRQASTFIKAGLLSGPQTIGKIAASHGTFLAMEEAKRIPASILDIAHSKVTGQDRQIAGADVGAMARAAHQAATAGVKDAITLLKHGDIGLAAKRNAAGDTSPIAQMGQAYENMHGEFDSKSKLLNAYVNTVMRSHGAMYEVMKRYALARALEEQATIGAMAQRKGTGGMTREQFQTARQTLLDNPSDTMVGNAIAAAEVATFINKNQFSEGFSGLKRGVRPSGALALDQLVPFPKVPSNVVARTAEYGGSGLVTELLPAVNSAIRKSMTPEQWQNFANSMGRASVGHTAGIGVLALGAYLASKGLMNATDWQTEQKKGRVPGSIKTKGLTFTVDGHKFGPFLSEVQMQGAAPFGNLLAAGASLYHAEQLPQKKQGAAKAKAVLAAIVEQPLLSASETVGRVQEDAKAHGLLTALGKQAAGRIIPAASAQIAAQMDKGTLRKQETLADAFKYRIPGARSTLKKKQASGGNPYVTKGIGSQMKMPSFNPGKG